MQYPRPGAPLGGWATGTPPADANASHLRLRLVCPWESRACANAVQMRITRICAREWFASTLPLGDAVLYLGNTPAQCAMRRSLA